MRRLERREALRHGAAAAGLVWAAPTTKSIRLRQAAGSGPPTQSSTTTVLHEPTAYEFAGVIPLSPRLEGDGCVPGTTASGLDFSSDLSELGTTDMSIRWCEQIQSIALIVVVSGSFSASNDSGSLIGVVTGGAFNRIGAIGPSNWEVHVEIDITGGSGLYQDALGSAVIDGTHHFFGDFEDQIARIDGEISGSFVA